MIVGGEGVLEAALGISGGGGGGGSVIVAFARLAPPRLLPSRTRCTPFVFSSLRPAPPFCMFAHRNTLLATYTRKQA